MRRVVFLSLAAGSLAFAQAAPAKDGQLRPEGTGDDNVETVTERVVPGTEPHAPGTWGNAYDAPANHRLTPGNVGIGVLRVGAAELGAAGVLRFSLLGQHFSQRDFPVLGATQVRTSATFGVSYVALDWLEVFLGYAAISHSNTRATPTTRATGDLQLGVRGARALGGGFYAGAELRANSLYGIGRPAFGLAPAALATYDFRDAFPTVPLRLHANLSFLWDRTSAVAGPTLLTASQTYAMGVQRYRRLGVGLAAEAPLPVATPFVEYRLAYPLGVAGGVLTGPDGVNRPVSQVMEQVASVGAKVTALRDLTVLLALDLGLTPWVGQGVPATPPYNVLLGLAYTFDPAQRPEVRVVERVRTRPGSNDRPQPVHERARLAGVVRDAQSGAPVGGAVVEVEGRDVPPVASEAKTGRFLTHELAPGDVTLRVTKNGYQPTARSVSLTKGAAVPALEFPLEPITERARLEVSAQSKGKQVPAQLVFRAPGGEHKLKLPAEGGATTPLELPPGAYTVDVVADGFLAQTRVIQAQAGAPAPLQFELQPAPSKPLASLHDKRIELRAPVPFGAGNAKLLPESQPILRSVVDVLVRSQVGRIRIEGHTDNRGPRDANLLLSEQRARAVADFLAAEGVDRKRLEVVGFGDTKPVAPNLTPKGRELNRRVEFVVLD